MLRKFFGLQKTPRDFQKKTPVRSLFSIEKVKFQIKRKIIQEKIFPNKEKKICNAIKPKNVAKTHLF